MNLGFIYVETRIINQMQILIVSETLAGSLLLGRHYVLYRYVYYLANFLSVAVHTQLTCIEFFKKEA